MSSVLTNICRWSIKSYLRQGGNSHVFPAGKTICAMHIKVTTSIRHRCFHPLKKMPTIIYGKGGDIIGKVGLAVITAAGIKSIYSMSALCNAEVNMRTPAKINTLDDPEFDWGKFLRMLLPYMHHLIAAMLGALAAALINIRIPIELGNFVDVISRAIQSNDVTVASLKEALFIPFRHLVFMYSIQAALTVMYIFLLSCIGERVATRMKQELFLSIMRQDVAFFDENKTGDILNTLTTDVQSFKSCFKLCVSQGIRSIMQIYGCAISLYVISPEMTAGMVLVIPTVIAIGSLLGSVLRQMSRNAQNQASTVTAVSSEVINNVRTVRAFAMEQVECEMFNKETKKARDLNEMLGLGIGIFQGGANLFLNGLVLGTLSAGSYLMLHNQVSPGDLMAFLIATQTMQRSLAQLSVLFGQVNKGVAAGARVFQLINHEPSMPIEGGQTIPYHSFLGNVSFSDVSFSYPTRPEQQILTNFNLTIPAGSTIAIVGTSGNGKSTIAALLERFYDADEGCITIDGIDIKELDPSWLRGKAIGFINQEPVLFAATIMENIRFGNQSATDKEVIEVSKLANADEFISKFPEGYNTVLGERGVTISGGQKQRIAIARALIKNPSILILDEATSALDAESEKAVQSALDAVARGRTVLVIAHRLSSIKNADLIVVLNDGFIVEKGTHSDLIAKKGFYWNLIRQQECEGNLRKKA